MNAHTTPQRILDLHQLQADWDRMADVDDAALIGRIEAGYAAATWLWLFLAIVLGVTLPLLATIALTRAFA